VPTDRSQYLLSPRQQQGFVTLYRPPSLPALHLTPELDSDDLETGPTRSEPSALGSFRRVGVAIWRAGQPTLRDYSTPEPDAFPDTTWLAPESVLQVGLQQQAVSNALLK
jgi:hypothetical protein